MVDEPIWLWCSYVWWIQKRLGSDVNMERPEKKPASSTTVHTSVRLRATSNLWRGIG